MKLTYLELSIPKTGESYHWYAAEDSIPEFVMQESLGPDLQIKLIMDRDYTLSRSDVQIHTRTFDYQAPWKGEPLTGTFIIADWSYDSESWDTVELSLDANNPLETVLLNRLGYLRIFRAVEEAPVPLDEERELETWIDQIMP